MGAYLSQPDTEKDSACGVSCHGHRYGLSSMQGWRRSQEDAHLVADIPGLADTAVFGVFDGHGGREVSNFAVSRFVRILKDLPAFSDDLASAMAPAFHRVDNLLEDPSNLKELKALKASPKASEEEGGSDDTGRDGAGESGKKIKVEDAVDLFQKMMHFKKMQQVRRTEE